MTSSGCPRLDLRPKHTFILRICSCTEAQLAVARQHWHVVSPQPGTEKLYLYVVKQPNWVEFSITSGRYSIPQMG